MPKRKVRVQDLDQEEAEQHRAELARRRANRSRATALRHEAERMVRLRDQSGFARNPAMDEWLTRHQQELEARAESLDPGYGQVHS